MSKICPQCNYTYDDDELICGKCGVNLVSQSLPSALNLGDANAISGGVNINQSRTVTSNDTHYHSTIIERTKTEVEIKLDATNQFRAKAEEIMAERGRIDSVAMGQLRPLANQLGIDDVQFKDIIKEVRTQSRGYSNGLSAANARYLLQAQQAVQTNDMDALSNLAPRLEAMAAISQDDNVQYLHHLSLAILYPLKSMELYERQTEENYWRTFWAIVSYIRTGKADNAMNLLAQFDPIRYEKPEEDQNLLEAFFNIMKEDKDGAQEFLDEIIDEPSAQIKPLHRAIECKVYEEEGDSLEVKFYMQRVMVKSDVVVKSVPKSQEVKVEDTKPSVEQKTAPIASAQSKDTSSGDTSEEANNLYIEAAKAKGAKRVLLLQKAAEAGSIDAMFELADAYDDGEGVEKNEAMAMKWLTKAADLGHALAQAVIGVAYYHGERGFDQNYALAEKYLLQASNQGSVEAQSFLCAVYVLMEEYDKALIWAKKAAQIANPLGCFILGRIYNEGLGVDANYDEAIKWYTIAASQGHVVAMKNLGVSYLEGEGVEQNNDSAIEWFEKSIEAGNIEDSGIYNLLGIAYYNSFNYEKAVVHFKKAAEMGSSGGMLNLGCCYRDGEGVEQNLELAEEWIRKAADAGQEDAIEIIKNNLSALSQSTSSSVGESAYDEAVTAIDQQDYEKACKKLLLAREEGIIMAQTQIIRLLEKGRSLSSESNSKSQKEAIRILTPFSNAGFIDACLILYSIYSDDDSSFFNENKNDELWEKMLSDEFENKHITQDSIIWSYTYGYGIEADYNKAIEWYQIYKDYDFHNNDNLSDTITKCANQFYDCNIKFNNIYLSAEDKRYLKVHIDWYARNLKGKSIQINVEFDGLIDLHETIVPPYDETAWTDYVAVIDTNKWLNKCSYEELKVEVEFNNTPLAYAKKNINVRYEKHTFGSNKLEIL